MWYKAFALQFQRFFESMEQEGHAHQEPFQLPWREYNIVPSKVERSFLVFALNHVLQKLSDLSVMLQARNDNCLEQLSVQILNMDDFYQKVRALRNPIEHDTDYLLGLGREQKNFNQVIDTDLGQMVTNPFCLIWIHGKCCIGTMDCREMFHHMMDVRDTIIPILDEICVKYELEEAEQKMSEEP